jgi:GT2 family glycosyltransferase
VSDVVPVSVVVPTIGRPAAVRSLLESLERCDPRPDDIVVVDQSQENEVAPVVHEFARVGARVAPSRGRGAGLARNVGLLAAKHEAVLGTDDDCTVGPDWPRRGWDHLRADVRAIVTGRVVPAGDPSSIPSTKDDPLPRDYTGDFRGFPLFTGNMALNRSLALDLGGFDEGLPAAEDNDFGYRWRRAGLRLSYDPAMVVWHHDWRTPEELESLYETYARGQAAFYAKHLRQGDLRMLSFIAGDFFSGLRGVASGLLHGRPRWSDPRRAALSGLAIGLVAGWRAYGPGRDPARELRCLAGPGAAAADEGSGDSRSGVA